MASRLRVEETIQQIIPSGVERKMDIEQIIDSMTPEVYQRLATAVELGKWPDGVALTPEQKENSLQLVMLWQARYNTDAQHMTIDTRGQMVMKSKQQLKEDFGIVPKPIATVKLQ
jgi:uncharacterized protein YeaC (DUF1315 family)